MLGFAAINYFIAEKTAAQQPPQPTTEADLYGKPDGTEAVVKTTELKLPGEESEPQTFVQEEMYLSPHGIPFTPSGRELSSSRLSELAKSKGPDPKPMNEKPAASDYRASSTDYRTSGSDYKATPDYRTVGSDYKVGSTDYKSGNSDYRSGGTDYRTGGTTDYRTGGSDYRAASGTADYRTGASDYKTSGTDYRSRDYKSGKCLGKSITLDVNSRGQNR